jgi:mannan endo-1,4-beta-mannosidase
MRKPLHCLSMCIFAAGLFLASCNEKQSRVGYPLVDGKANDLTQNLYRNLHAQLGTGVMFGHQNTTAYGYRWTSESIGSRTRSDVKDVTGSFPAVYGWDVADFLHHSLSNEQRTEQTNRLLSYSREAFDRGGILTYSWHAFNPLTKESFYDTTNAVYSILPGGAHHEDFKTSLDQLASFFHELAPAPAIFRPWHEHNGDWFWWGKGICTEQDYIDLWKFTVTYLRDEKQVRNVIYAYSPDRSRLDIDQFDTGYLYGYPGDEYVDVMGLDNYWDMGHPANIATAEKQQSDLRISMEYLVNLADSRRKVPALSEGGYEAIPDSAFWTGKILDALLTNDTTKRISYFLVWRNANFEREKRDHYYAPYPGQVSAADFIHFREHPFVLFEDELPDMYANAIAPSKTIEYPATDPRVQIMGRHQKDPDGSVSFGASGVTFQLSFQGTYLDIKLEDEHRDDTNYNWFAVSVNGSEPTFFRTIKGRVHYRLAGRLPFGLHHVTLMKQTEGQNGHNRLVSITTDSLVAAMESPARKIEFIGDSITSGFGSDSTNTPCGQGTWFDQHDVWSSYGVLTARALQSQWMLSSVSGMGMYRNWNSPAPVMPDVYDGIYMEYAESTSRWAFDSYSSDLVVVALGTNDFSDGEGPKPRAKLDPLAFVRSYDAFVDRLRARYPQAQILLTTSPMLDANQNDLLASYLERVVESQRSKGFPSIRLFRYSGRYIDGCNTHPSKSNHQLIANELIPIIQDMMQW